MIIVTNLFFGIKHLLQRDKEKCPRCGKTPFMHGFKYNNEQYFCTHCHLWKRDWNTTDIEIKKLMEKGGEENEN